MFVLNAKTTMFAPLAIPMKTEEEAIHFLKSAEVQTGKKCFIRHVNIGKFEKWKIFVSEQDYESYLKDRKHKR